MIIALCVVILNGCTGDSNYYAGIKKTDFPFLTDSNIEFVYEYRGNSDNWGAVFFVYKRKDSKKLQLEKYLVYNGKDSKPLGEISYDYEASNNVVGSGGMTASEVQEIGVYYLGPSVENPAPTKDSTIKLLVKWKDQSEWIELKPVTD